MKLRILFALSFSVALFGTCEARADVCVNNGGGPVDVPVGSSCQPIFIEQGYLCQPAPPYTWVNGDPTYDVCTPPPAPPAPVCSNLVPQIQISGYSAQTGINGWVDGISRDPSSGHITVSGWACELGSPNSVLVQVEASLPWGMTSCFEYPVMANQVFANLPSEPAVAAACRSTGSHYRFAIDITAAAHGFDGQSLFVGGGQVGGGFSFKTLGNGNGSLKIP